MLLPRKSLWPMPFGKTCDTMAVYSTHNCLDGGWYRTYTGCIPKRNGAVSGTASYPPCSAVAMGRRKRVLLVLLRYCRHSCTRHWKRRPRGYPWSLRHYCNSSRHHCRQHDYYTTMESSVCLSCFSSLRSSKTPRDELETTNLAHGVVSPLRIRVGLDFVCTCMHSRILFSKYYLP